MQSFLTQSIVHRGLASIWETSEEFPGNQDYFPGLADAVRTGGRVRPGLYPGLADAVQQAQNPWGSSASRLEEDL